MFLDKKTALITGSSRGIGLADMDEDGNLDFVTSLSNHYLVRALGSSNCTFFGSIIASQVDLNPWKVYLADLDLDDHEDTVVGHGVSDQIAIYLGQGDGNVVGPHIIDTTARVNDLALGDFNQDGLPDIVYAGTETVYILLTDNFLDLIVYQNLVHGLVGDVQAAIVGGRLVIEGFGRSGDDGVSVLLNSARLWNGEVELEFDSGSSTELAAVSAGETGREEVSGLVLQERNDSLSFSTPFAQPTDRTEYLQAGELIVVKRGIPSGSQANQWLLDEIACVLEGAPSFLCNLTIEFQQNVRGECEWSVEFEDPISIERNGEYGPLQLIDAIRLIEEEDGPGPLERMALSEIRIQGQNIASLTFGTERTELDEVSALYLPAIVR